MTGYAVTAGKYFADSKNSKITTQFAAGAPRGGLNRQLSGHVTIFTFPESDEQPLLKLQELDGPPEAEVGTYFGSVLCSVDMNGDGYTDLLVGAPRYGTRTQFRQTSAPQVSKVDPSGRILNEGFTGYGDEGAVFVYISDGVIISSHLEC